MTENLAAYLQKSEEELATAQLIIKEFPNAATIAHNCYYAYFWIVRGLLAEKGVIAKKHAGAHQMFGLHFIKIGEIPAHFNDYLYDLFDQRLIADYDLDGEFDTEQLKKLMKYVEEFLTFVKTKYA